MRYARIGYLGVALCAAALSICSTGCMLAPQHGENVGRIDDSVSFAGATTRPGERLEVQVLRPGVGWQRLVRTTAGNSPYEDESGTWYCWYTRARIGHEFWREAGGGLMSAQVRTISLDDEVLGDVALFTFRDGFNPHDYLDVSEMWDDYGYGRSVTIYARR